MFHGNTWYSEKIYRYRYGNKTFYSRLGNFYEKYYEEVKFGKMIDLDENGNGICDDMIIHDQNNVDRYPLCTLPGYIELLGEAEKPSLYTTREKPGREVYGETPINWKPYLITAYSINRHSYNLNLHLPQKTWRIKLSELSNSSPLHGFYI